MENFGIRFWVEGLGLVGGFGSVFGSGLRSKLRFWFSCLGKWPCGLGLGQRRGYECKLVWV